MKHRIEKFENEFNLEVDKIFKRVEDMYEDYLNENSIQFLYKTFLSAMINGKEEGIIHDQVKNRVLVRYEFKGFLFPLHGYIEDLFLEELSPLLHQAFYEEKEMYLDIEAFLFNGRLNIWVAFDPQDKNLSDRVLEFKSKNQILAKAKEIREQAITIQEAKETNDPKNQFIKRTEEIVLPNLDILTDSFLVYLSHHIEEAEVFSLGEKRFEDHGTRIIIEKILDIGCLSRFEDTDIMNHKIWELIQEEKKQETLNKKEINVVENTFYNIIGDRLNQIFKETKSSFFVKNGWLGYEETRKK